MDMNKHEYPKKKIVKSFEIKIFWKPYFALGFDILERFWNSKKRSKITLEYSDILKWTSLPIPILHFANNTGITLDTYGIGKLILTTLDRPISTNMKQVRYKHIHKHLPTKSKVNTSAAHLRYQFTDLPP